MFITYLIHEKFGALEQIFTCRKSAIAYMDKFGNMFSYSGYVTDRRGKKVHIVKPRENVSANG